MYPILFNSTATAWATFGIGVLSDAISCEVEENRNGTYELELTYPVSGVHFTDIALRCLIVAKPNYTDDPQPFRVYHISKPLDGIVTISAQHISYDLSGYVDAPFTATGIQNAIQQMTSQTVIYPTACPFTLTTDLSGTGTMTVKHPTSVRALMGGIEGSLLDNYGGEWQFDGYNCTLKGSRGADRGVVIRYGKNLTDLRQEENNSSVYTAVYPYYYNADTETLVTLDEKVVQVSGTFNYTNVLQLDLSSEFSEPPTTIDLRARAEKYIQSNNIGVPKVNLTIGFQQLDTLSDRVDLCDTVSVRFDALGVSASAKCIRTKWDVLKERYIEAELGSARASLAASIAKTSEIVQLVNRKNSFQIADIARDIAGKIVGHSGGYIMLHDTNNDDAPDEILIMDNADISLATKIIRINNAGIAFSKTGYNGTYLTAWNIDGEFVADFIASGTLATNHVKILGDTQFYWDNANITLVDPSNTNRVVKFGKYDGTNYGLGFSTDGGSTWRAGFGFNGITVLSGNNTTRASVYNGAFGINRSTNEMLLWLGDTESHNASGTEGTFPVYECGTWKSIGFDTTSFTFAQAHGCYSFTAGHRNIPAGAFSFCAGNECESRGNYSVAMGYQAVSVADYSVSIGYDNIARGTAAVAFGYDCEVTKAYGLTNGYKCTAGLAGVALGYQCTAGNYSLAAGNSNNTTGQYSASIGSSNEVSGNYATALGYGNQATKLYSFAAGYNNKAIGNASNDATCIAIGWANQSIENCAVTIGSHNIASEQYAFALGTNLNATGVNQFVCGGYNISNANKQFIIGNGNGVTSTRSNAVEVDYSGNMWIAGTLTQRSDRRLKTIIGAPQDMSQIRAVRYKWKKGDANEHIGYIAQDVEEVAPYLVETDSEGHKALDYIGLLCAKVEQLERTVELLTKKIEALEAKG